MVMTSKNKKSNYKNSMALRLAGNMGPIIYGRLACRPPTANSWPYI